MNEKIKSREDIQRLAEDLKRSGKKIVAVSGSFDFFHLGHIKFFQKAKKTGGVLFVLLNSDKSIEVYKGRPPVMNQDLRARTIASLGCVDYVVLFDELTPNNVLAKIKPDIYCIGSGWGEDCIERKIIEENGGRVYVLPRTKGVSTSELIKRMMEFYSNPLARAVMLDRDGTINYNQPEYCHRIEDFKFIPGAIEALQRLSLSEYKIAIITNQSGIGRGYFSEEDFHILNNWMLDYLKKRGIRIDGVYYCPHHPDEGCGCRKPGIELFLKAAKELGLNLSKSWYVGDSKSDVVAGRSCNLQTIKLGDPMPPEMKLEPHFYARDLVGAVDIILHP